MINFTVYIREGRRLGLGLGFYNEFYCFLYPNEILLYK